MPQIPDWIQMFVLVGIGALVIVIPLKVLYDMTKGARERTRKLEELAARLKERFGEVKFERGLLGPHRLEVKLEGRSATLFQPDPDVVVLRLEPKVAPKFHAIVRTRGAFEWPWAFMAESFRLLRRVRTSDPLIDESILIYATPVFGNYFRELALDGIPLEGKPTGLAESLIVLRRTPGVKEFEFRMSPAGGFRLAFRLRTDDLLFRPDEMEAAVHHAFRLYDLLVLY